MGWVTSVLEGETPVVAPDPDVEASEEKVRFARLKRFHVWAHKNPISSLITKIVVTIVGAILILAGIVMLFTPGQGILAVVLGLAVLSSEYEWAKRLRHRAEAKLKEARDNARAMDPKVRRRRIVLTVLATVLVVGAVIWYLAVYDWPSFAVDGWDRLQSISGLVPELPGM